MSRTYISSFFNHHKDSRFSYACILWSMGSIFFTVMMMIAVNVSCQSHHIKLSSIHSTDDEPNTTILPQKSEEFLNGCYYYIDYVEDFYSCLYPDLSEKSRELEFLISHDPLSHYKQLNHPGHNFESIDEMECFSSYILQKEGWSYFQKRYNIPNIQLATFTKSTQTLGVYHHHNLFHVPVSYRYKTVDQHKTLCFKKADFLAMTGQPPQLSINHFYRSCFAKRHFKKEFHLHFLDQHVDDEKIQKTAVTTISHEDHTVTFFNGLSHTTVSYHTDPSHNNLCFNTAMLIQFFVVAPNRELH